MEQIIRIREGPIQFTILSYCLNNSGDTEYAQLFLYIFLVTYLFQHYHAFFLFFLHTFSVSLLSHFLLSFISGTISFLISLPPFPNKNFIKYRIASKHLIR
jgi:hypothetical protein